MKKPLLVIGIVLLAGVAIFFYRNSGPPKSPPGTATFSQGNLDVKVAYHRPFKRGRLIFGEKDAGALVPFGKYWRLGANESASITLARQATFGGKPVSAGTYRMYAIPAATSWKVVLNSSPTRFGAMEPDKDKDVVSVDVPVETTPEKVEQFTINITPDQAGAKLEFNWDGTLVRVPLAAAN